MAIKLKGNVTHNGILYKAGDVLDHFALDVHQSLVDRGLAEVTESPATHGVEADASARALPLNPSAPTEPTQAEIDKENADRKAAQEAAEAASAASAAAQTAAAARIQDGGQPTQAEIEAAAAGVN